MSEERTQYTVHPDVAIRLDVAERHIKQLESTNDGLTMVMGRHADTITAQRERIAELENANVAMSERIRYLNTIGSVFRTTVREQSETINEMSVSIAELEAALHDTTAQLATATETIARLEADNRRLRHLDAMPVDAMRRLVEYCEWTQSEEYPVNQHIADYNAAIAYFRTMDGDA